MTRARSNVEEIDRDLAAAIQVLRLALSAQIEDGNEVDTALCSVETFGAVALRVMRHTNPSKVREAAQVIEMKARMDGIPVVRTAA